MHTSFRGLVKYDAGDALVQREGQKFNGLYVFGATDPDYQLQHNGFPMGYQATLAAGGSPLSPRVCRSPALGSGPRGPLAPPNPGRRGPVRPADEGVYARALRKQYALPPTGAAFTSLHEW